jgi:putative transposase
VIVTGHIDTDHVHLLLSSPPSLAPAKIAQYLKGRSSPILQDEYPQLKKRYWGQHLWGRGYFCATTGVITEETIKEYIEKHTESSDNITVRGEFKS